MRRLAAALLAAAMVLVVLASPVAAAAPFPSQIALPNGWQPEGITAGRGTTAYVGSLANGAIARVNLRTGAVDPTFIPGGAGRVTVGLFYDRETNRLWVAGGPTGQVRVYDARSGALLASYAFTAGFINDLVVTPDGVFATDSVIPQLLVVPATGDGPLPPATAAFTIPITGDMVYGAGFNANGIEWRNGTLILPQSNTGQLFAVDPSSGVSTELLAPGAVTFADGVRFIGNTLYVSRNMLNQVDRYRFAGSRLVFLGTVSSPALDIPTTLAFAAGRLWTVNARFTTPPTPDTSYAIVRVPRR